MGFTWGWHGVGMGLAWGWHGVSTGLARGRMGLGLAWGWHGVGMGLAWGLPIDCLLQLQFDWRLTSLLEIYWQSIRQPIRPTIAVLLHILCAVPVLRAAPGPVGLDQLRRRAGKKRRGHDERNLAHQGPLGDLLPWSNARD
jgi:hypothetical protein